jgi:hypothetical protein
VVAELADDLDPAVLDAALSVVQQHHPLLNVYVEDHPQTGPVGRLRRFVQTPGAVNAATQSDLRKVARAIIPVADQIPAPTRLALGPDAYDYIHEELTTRIAELESLTDVSSGVAVDGPCQSRTGDRTAATTVPSDLCTTLSPNSAMRRG